MEVQIMANNEYRIIFFFDSRYKTDRYVIVGGDYMQALHMVKYLNNTDFASNVSRYYPINRQYVNEFSRDSNFKLKVIYQDMAKRNFWANALDK